ncbi:sigma-70 family RNA polymerase sigma factor [Corallococcus sp. CA049B]|uniref:sigma-70 family RNA polymerase sigma factor n=1 Tax=Corallococcus sp. CA049B TaxID=2316730 RepID=UPI000EA22EFF|nr:sigma-70 family RNA polymerase sigma factor [Corallococcus sp. CA049B]RKG90998.1 sigma-70 family RNA polymerase sigma factor [Corallococcus sp. CA049B]
MSPTPLASAFLAVPGRAPASLPEPSHLEDLLRASIDRARARWPGVELEPLAFVAFVAERLTSPPVLLEALEGASPAFSELYLASGCLRHDRAALQFFEDGYLRDVGAFVSGVDRSPAFVAEVRQLLRERLFTGEPKIAEFTGGGALGGWVRVAALRIALNLKRSEARADSAAQDSVESAFGEQLGPELEHLRSRYREAFTEAVRTALGGLSDRDRTLMRLYHVEALSLDAIAALYRVHMSTVSRWLSRAREQVAESTTRRLCERLGVGASSVDSIAALVVSQVDLSLTRLLGPGG